MRISTLLLSFFVSAVSFSAFSSVLIEPVVGYQTAARLEIDGNSGVGYSSGDGFAYGGRLGWQTGGFQLGADYLAGSFELDAKTDTYKKHSTSDLGAFAGFELGYFRLYGGYIFSSSSDSKDSFVGDITFKSGSGYKAGLSMNLLSWLALNVEYRKVTYDKVEANGQSGSLDNDISLESVLVGVSFPFNLGGK